MPDAPTKLQRWLDLIAFLVGRRVPVTVEELMERIPAYAEKWSGGETAQATARRTFERDKDELRKAGIPIRTVKYTINWGREEIEGYRLDRKDFYLPYVRLLEEHGEAEPSPVRPSFDLEAGELDLAVRALGRVADLPSFPFAADARSALRKLTFDLHDRLGDGPAPVLCLERPGDAGKGERVTLRCRTSPSPAGRRAARSVLRPASRCRRIPFGPA